MACLLRLLCLLTVTGGVLFAVARLYHFLWRATCSHAIDPASLSTTTLRRLLDDWSVDYRHVVETSELVQMVKKLSPLDEQHVKSVQAVDTAALTPDTTFTSGRAFYRDMTSGKHSCAVWLVIIVTGLDESLAESPALDTWTSVRKHATRLGVRTGILDCAYQSQYCQERGWMTAHFLFVLPQNIENDFYRGRPGSGRAESASVNIHVYKGPVNKRSILTWVEERLQEKIVNIVSLTRLHSKWLTYGARSGPAFRAVFFTDQTTTPTFLSMASIQYMDMVQFGVIRETNGHLLKWMKENNVGDTFPQLLVLSRDGINYVYGKAVGEYLSLASLQNFFDMFMSSEIELFCCFFVGLCGVAIGRHRSQRLTCSMFHFGIAFTTWWGVLVPGKSLFSMNRHTSFPVTAPLLTTIPVGSSLLQDLLFYAQHPYLLVICLVLACFCLDRLMLWVDFVHVSANRTARCLSSLLQAHTGYLPRSATCTRSRSRKIASVPPAMSRPSVGSPLTRSERSISLENNISHTGHQESGNDIENSETSRAHMIQSDQEPYSDSRSENSETEKEGPCRQIASTSTTDFISPSSSESDSREGGQAGTRSEVHEHSVADTAPANMTTVRRRETHFRRERDRLRSRSRMNVYVADQHVPETVDTHNGADTDTTLPRQIRIHERDRLRAYFDSHNRVSGTTGSETTPFTSDRDTHSDSSEPAPTRFLPRNLGSPNLRAGLHENSQNNTAQADYAAEHQHVEGDTTHNSARASTGAERGLRFVASAAEPTSLSAPVDVGEDSVQMRRSPSFRRRQLMRERRMPMLLVERDGQQFLVPFFQRFYPPEGYIDHLPTWEYSAGVERMEAAGASGTSVAEDCVDGCFGSTASEQSGIPARPVQSGLPAGYVDCFVCVICLCEFTNAEKMCGLPCKHFYHDSCIKHWLAEGRHSCPMCRKPAYKL